MTISCKSCFRPFRNSLTSGRYHGDAAMASYMLYKEKKEGVLSTFPFGAFAYARLDDRLQNEPLWQKAKREPGRDPMGLTPKQPNIEFFTTEASLRPLAGESFADHGIVVWRPKAI